MLHRHVHLVEVSENEQSPDLTCGNVVLYFEDNDESGKIFKMPFVKGSSTSNSTSIDELKAYLGLDSSDEDLSSLYREENISVYEHSGTIFSMKLENKLDNWISINSSWPSSLHLLFQNVYLPLKLVSYV